MPIWLQKLLGGRPMIVCEPSFVDKVSGKTVFNCIDVFGRMWHANSAWSFFRCRKGADWLEEVARREAEETFLNSEGRSGGSFYGGSFYDLGKDA